MKSGRWFQSIIPMMPALRLLMHSSTMVIDGTQLKLYVWYDNEWGYVNRMMELAAFIGKDL